MGIFQYLGSVLGAVGNYVENGRKAAVWRLSSQADASANLEELIASFAEKGDPKKGNYIHI